MRVKFNRRAESMILLLAGWARSGKDAAASLLQEEMGFMRFAFADALKHEVAAIHGLPVDIFHLDAKNVLLPESNKTPRDLLLDHARAARAADPDVYARQVLGKILWSNRERIVISDWRYRREYDFLTRFAGRPIVTCRIVRPGITQMADPSEHDLDDQPMDFTIQNDGGISDLRDRLKEMLQ